MMEATEQGLFAGFADRDAELLRENVRNALAVGGYECVLHPLGFYFIRLAARGDTTIRLHYWSARHRENGTAMTPYHDHVWSLCSCVIAGAIENVLLELDPDETGDFQVADINQIGNVDEVVPRSSRVRIRIQSTETHRAGEFYEMPPRIFHYTNVRPGETALTVVQATTTVKGGPRTLVPVSSAGHMPSRDPITDPDKILIEIGQLVSGPGGRKDGVVG
jgi:hypothetical protein